MHPTPASWRAARPALAFAELAPPLAELGYECVPVKPGTKACPLPTWQDGHPPERYLPDHAAWGVGILCRTTPAIDIDVPARPLVRVLVELIDNLVGGAPVRFGQPPKALLPFSTDRPFAKVATKWFALPGEDFTADTFRAKRCEVLGAGQMFVASAVHPGTKRPYRWCRGDPFTQYRIDLPYLDAAGARRFVAAAERVFLAGGGIALERDGRTWRPWSEQRETPCRAGDGAVLAGARAADLARRLDPKARRTGASWRARCPVHQGQSHTSLALKEENGVLLWHCFAGCSQADVAKALEAAA